ncbi:MAG: TonB-dependent receptor [Candidatus Marinimicrobia bacterium]|nr:TonB-dependent receptor [Candidatus Neomarinimicrobiota bacterium]
MVKRILITLLLVILPLMIFGQTSGKISGVVTNKQTGEPISGVNVVVQGPTTPRGAATGPNGEFTILYVPVGTYTVKATYMGMADVVINNVNVSLDHTTQLNIEMRPQDIEGESITITAQRELVRQDETNATTVKSAEEISNMPIRGVENLVATTAGVVKQDNSGSMNIRGGRSGGTAMYVDGVLVNDPYNNASRVYLPNNAIQEMSVQTGGFSAEYGEALSGIIAVTTQVGSEDYHASFEALTDNMLSAEDKYLGTYSYGFEEYVGTISGPIIPGTRHTFFGSLTRRYEADAWPSWGWAENEYKPDTYTYETPLISGFETDTATGQLIADAPIYGDTLTKQYDLNARIPGNYTSDWSVTGKLKLQLMDNMHLRGSIVRTDRKISDTDVINLFNQKHDDTHDQYSQSINATLVHNITKNTMYEAKFNYFDTQREYYDPVYGDDFEKYGDPEYNLYTASDELTAEERDLVIEQYKGREYLSVAGPITPDFNNYGNQDYTYFKNRTTYWGIDFDISHQWKDHHFKAGFDYKYHTLRKFQFIIGYPWDYAKEYETEVEKYMNADISYYGYDVNAEETDEGDFLEDVKRDETGLPTGGYKNQKPYHPIIMSTYFQDKFEYKDIVLNLGLRYDRIDPNAWQFKEIAAEYDDQGNYVEGTGMFSGDGQFDQGDVEESEVYDYLSPRLGVSFPVTENTNFHTNYGIFYQRPDLADLYLSPFYLNTFVHNGGYFTAIDNPNLRPEKNIQYEIGLNQRLASNIALKLTAFYKETEDLVQLLPVTTDIKQIAFYDNGDYGVVKGLDIVLRMRRTNNLAINFDYELQFADGTGSASASNFDIAWQQGTYGNFPKFQKPLAFEQRHTGNINVDYRYGDDGPGIFKNTGVNLLARFNSGQRYTRMKIYNSNPYRGLHERDADSQKPVSEVMGETMPWNYRFDLKLDKSFTFGRSRLVVYATVLNLFNTKNVQNVWRTTGEPDQSGFHGTTAGKEYLDGLTEEEYNLVMLREMDWTNYGIPRMIRLGFRVEL